MMPTNRSAKSSYGAIAMSAVAAPLAATVEKPHGSVPSTIWLGHCASRGRYPRSGVTCVNAGGSLSR